MAFFHVRNLEKKFGKLNILKGVNLSLNHGEVVSIIGPSGAGKTTLLRCMAMIEPFEAGEVHMGESTVTPFTLEEGRKGIRRRVGAVFQELHLWPHMTALENITEPLTMVKKMSRLSAYNEACFWLKRAGVMDKTNEYPESLSSGQKQRVAIARTLAMRPDVALLDEITSALDPELVSGVLSLVREIAEERTRTVVLVTHDMGFAREVADKIVFIDQGFIVEYGTPQQVFNEPREERTRDFLRHVHSFYE